MPRLHDTRRSACTRVHAWLCLLVVLTLLRAFIPTGYMPDPGALAQGRFALVPCPAAGSMPGPGVPVAGLEGAAHAAHAEHAVHAPYAEHVARAEHATHAAHAEHVAHAAHADHATHSVPSIHVSEDAQGHAHVEAGMTLDCPFSLMAHVSADLPPLRTLDALPVRLAAVPTKPPQQSLPPLPAAGPPMGPRAPPALQA